MQRPFAAKVGMLRLGRAESIQLAVLQKSCCHGGGLQGNLQGQCQPAAAQCAWQAQHDLRGLFQVMACAAVCNDFVPVADKILQLELSW